MTTRDYYHEARQIAEMLKQEGLLEYAQALNDAIEEGSTGTEILMRLHFQLEKYSKKRISENSSLMSKIKELTKDISKVLT